MQQVDKPWGYEVIWADTPFYIGKTLVVEAGHSLSLQYHNEKHETMHVINGEGIIQISNAGDELKELPLTPGGVITIPPSVVHRVIAKTDLWIIEVSTPHKDDIVRLEDNYGRANTIVSESTLSVG